MSTRQARQARREAERKAKKLAAKQQRTAAPELPDFMTSDYLHDLQLIERAAINRANAQSSTGPRTPEGKAKSSRNSFKHGLYSKEVVVEGEDPAELDALKSDLRAEHQPASTTEEILINEMAEQYWRIKRARRLEARSLAPENIDQCFKLIPMIQRTMTAAERGFHKALAALQKLQKARNGFVPENRPAEPPAEPIATPEIGFLPEHFTPEPDSEPKFAPQNDPIPLRQAA